MKKEKIYFLWEEYKMYSKSLIDLFNKNRYIFNHYFLHPTRPRYSIINQLYKIYNLNFSRKLILKFQSFLNLLFLIFKIFNFDFSKNEFLKKNENNLSKENFDLIVVSHLNNLEQFDSKIDSYYGNLINYITQKGKKVLLVFFPHCKINKELFLKFQKENSNHHFYILSESLIERKIKIQFLLGLINAKKFLIRKAPQNNVYKKNLNFYASQTIISRDNFQNLLFSYLIKKITKICKVKNIITTYEGHSWEKMFYAASREANLKIKCFGYQHTLIFKHDYSIFNLINKKFQPDIILTSGKKTKDIFLKNLKKEIEVYTLGSPKHNLIKNQLMKNRKNILFIPSGEEEESFAFTKYAYKFAKLNPKMKVIIRYHPVIKNKFLVRNSLISNFKISNREIEEDCLISRWAVYSSSTAIFEAIQFGCIPIHLSYDEIVNLNNPLWQINSEFIKKATNFQDLNLIIKKTMPINKDNQEIIIQYKNTLLEIQKLRCQLNEDVILENLN